MRRPCGIYDTSYSEDMSVVRTKTQWGLLIACIALFALVPFFITGSNLVLMIYICISIVVALGLNLLTGYCGQISLGQAAFMGVGAFAAAHIATTFLHGSAWGFWVALPLSGLIAGLVGLIFGFPSLRIKGLYLALTTLAAQFIIHWALVHFVGGDRGVHVKAPRIGDFAFNSDFRYYYIVFIAALLTIFVAKNIVRTQIGRRFIAIRDNDIAAESLGYNIFTYKLIAFFTGCFFAGVGGCLWTFYLGLASVEHYTLWDSVWYLGMIIIGGMGSITGTILGVFFVKVLQEVSNILGATIGMAFPNVASNVAPALPILVFSLVALLFLMFEPRGLAHRWEIIKSWYRLWPFGYR